MYSDRLDMSPLGSLNDEEINYNELDEEIFGSGQHISHVKRSRRTDSEPFSEDLYEDMFDLDFND
jgi:hypothetical protein